MTARTQAQRSADTIAALTTHARRLFAERGYAQTSIEDIVSSAQVTRGALYHHFEGKPEIFRAVFTEVQRELADHTASVALGAPGGVLDKLAAGCVAFVDACMEPGVQQIFLVDGFTVLGWHQLRALEADHTLANLRIGIEQAIESGEISPRPAEPLVALLFGGVCELVMTIARSDDPERSRREALAEVRRMFAGLAAQGRPGGDDG